MILTVTLHFTFVTDSFLILNPTLIMKAHFSPDCPSLYITKSAQREVSQIYAL